MHQASCAHCGIPVPAPETPDAELFCCYGCEVAYALVGQQGSASNESKLAFYKFVIGCIIGINVMMFSMPLYVESLGSFFAQGIGAAEFFSLLKWLLMAISLPVFFLLGNPFIESSVRNLRRGSSFNADILIAIGVVAAFLVSIFNTIIVDGPVYYETAVGILVIVSAGRYLEARSRAKAIHELKALEKKNVTDAYVLRSNGTIEQVRPSLLGPGMIILVRPGESIPVDAVITSGEANVGQAMLTGESRPVVKHVGDEVRAGAINYDGVLLLRVLRPESESYLASISNLMDQARQSRTMIEATADRISRIAVPIVVVVALASFIYWLQVDGLRAAFLTSLSVLLIACPCALGIATPAALWVALTESSKRGILFRSLAALERLAGTKAVFFDKTGTLTVGTPHVIRETLHSDLATSVSWKELLRMVQAVTSLSRHPISQALASYLPKSEYAPEAITHFREIPSQGLIAMVDGVQIRLGKHSHVDPAIETEHNSSTIWCSLTRKEDRTLIEFQLEDELLPEAKNVLQQLHESKYDVTILSGDNGPAVKYARRETGVTAIAELLPHEKVAIVQQTPHSVFVGDGINDAAAIAAANVGIALSHAADLARQNADIVIFEHKLERIPQVLRYSRRTFSIIKQNLFWAFAYNGIGVVAAALGLLNPIIAALAMTVSSFMVIQNSLRLRGRIAAEAFDDH